MRASGVCPTERPSIVTSAQGFTASRNHPDWTAVGEGGVVVDGVGATVTCGGSADGCGSGVAGLSVARGDGVGGGSEGGPDANGFGRGDRRIGASRTGAGSATGEGASSAELGSGLAGAGVGDATGLTGA